MATKKEKPILAEWYRLCAASRCAHHDLLREEDVPKDCEVCDVLKAMTRIGAKYFRKLYPEESIPEELRL